MADFSNLILLSILAALLLIVILIFGNKICGFTTNHKQLYKRRDYFSIQSQLLASNQQHLFCSNCKKEKKFFSTSTKTSEVSAYLSQLSEELPLHHLPTSGNIDKISTTSISPQESDFSTKVMIQNSSNCCSRELCLQKNDTV